MNRSIWTQAANVSQRSASIQEMIADIKSISQVIDRSAKSFLELQEATDVGRFETD